MANYPAGILLSCIHDECLCRVRVEVECHCEDAGGAYRCTCGAEMAPVKDQSTAAQE